MQRERFSAASVPMAFDRGSPSDLKNTVCSYRRFSRRQSRMLISTTIFLFFLFLTYALFLVASRKSDARHSRLQQRVAEALQDSDKRLIEPVEISRSDSIGGSETVN